MRSVKQWLYLFSTDDPHSLVVRSTHSQVRTATAVVRPSPPGRVAQSVGHRTRKSGVLGSIPGLQHTFVSPSAFSRRAVVSYWRKYVHEVLVNRLGGLSLPRKSVVRLTDRPDMTLACLPWT